MTGLVKNYKTRENHASHFFQKKKKNHDVCFRVCSWKTKPFVECFFSSHAKVAGYCMYGSATELVMTFYGSGVHRFTLDPSLGEFIHIEANVRIPAQPKVSFAPSPKGCVVTDQMTTASNK